MRKKWLPSQTQLVCALWILACPTHIAAQEKSWWTAGLFLDNDLFANEDDGYTNGVRLNFTSPDLRSFEKDRRLPSWLRSINKRLEFIRPDEKGLARNMVVTLGQQMYTPSEQFIDEADLVSSDRPYAGWLYLGFGYQMRSSRRLETAIANFGVVGPSARAKESQDFIHDLRGFDKFRGWDNQLKNEFGLQLLYTRKNIVYRTEDRERWGSDVITQWGGSLGNVATHLETGIEWRFGLRLPEDFGTSSATPGGDNSAPRSSNDSRVQNRLIGGIHVYAALNGRWVIRDITLDGNTFRNSHSVDKEPLIGSMSVGLVMNVKRWQLGFSRLLTTEAFEGQEQSRGYGSVSISYTYAYD